MPGLGGLTVRAYMDWRGIKGIASCSPSWVPSRSRECLPSALRFPSARGPQFSKLVRALVARMFLVTFDPLKVDSKSFAGLTVGLSQVAGKLWVTVCVTATCGHVFRILRIGADHDEWFAALPK